MTTLTSYGLSKVEDVELKAEQHLKAITAMEGKPVTEKQVAFVERKGYQFGEEMDRALASEIISYIIERNKYMIDGFIKYGFLIKK